MLYEGHNVIAGRLLSVCLQCNPGILATMEHLNLLSRQLNAIITCSPQSRPSSWSTLASTPPKRIRAARSFKAVSATEHSSDRDKLKLTRDPVLAALGKQAAVTRAAKARGKRGRPQYTRE
jgi:hypothetical protein